MSNHRDKILGLGLAAMLPMGLMATGCDPETPDSGDDDDDVTTATTEIRVMHLSPDAPAVDIWVDGELRAVEGLAFPDSTGYLELDAGVYDLAIAAAGADADDAVLKVDDAILRDGTRTTAVAYGTLDDLRAMLLTDDYDGLDDGNIRVRAIHTAAGVGEVDIWEISDKDNPLALYTDVDFGEVGGYLDLPAGAYNLGFDVDDDMSPDLTFALPELAAGTVANVFAVLDGDGAVSLQAQLEDGSTAGILGELPAEPAQLRVLHLSRDAGMVDVYADGGLAVSELGFAQGTDYLTLDAGAYDIDITATGGDPMDAVFSIDGLALDEGTDYTAVAFGDAASLSVMALVDDTEGLDAGMIRIRAIHAAPTVGQVDIWEISDMNNPLPLYTDVDFGAVGDYLDLPAMPYTLGFDLDDDASPDVTFSIPALPEGTVANVFAAADADDTVFLHAQLPDGAGVRLDADPMIPMANLRVLHLSPDAPAVDIWIDGALSGITDLAFGFGTDYVEITEGAYDISIAPAGGMLSDSVLDIASLPLMGDTYYTAVAFDEVADIAPMALVDDYSPMPANTIRVRAIHAAAGVEQVDIWEVSDINNPLALYPDFDFGAVGDYLELPAGAYTLGFDLDNDASPDVTFELPTLAAGTIANVFAVSDDLGNVFLLPQLEAGNTARIDPS